MCGIAGIIGNFQISDLETIKVALKHRGPDKQSSFKQNEFSFVHSLLKIMDLTDQSTQPMIDDNSGNVIIFNGSIYNYKDLKKDFFQNYKFKSNTDTEILLKMYAKFGINFLNYIKGMYAFALFDKKKNKIYIFRDKFGIKPLFYFSKSNFFIFASEIKVLLKNKIVRNSIEVDFKKTIEFIANRQLNGSDSTLIKNIKILKPGNFVEYDLKLKKFEIYDFDFKKNQKKNNYFEDVLKESLNYLTITQHKKIACLLSGGLDSSLLSIVLNSQNNNKEIHTFSSILNQPNSENRNIHKLVKDYKFNQHFILEDSIDFFEDHLKTIRDIDQPTPDASSTLHNVLCRKVAENGFKVLFTGNGGDENFFGYPLHAYGYLANILQKGQFIKYCKKVSLLKKLYKNKNIFIRSLKELINTDILNILKTYQLKSRIEHLNVDKNKYKINFYEKFSKDIFKNIVLNYNSHWGLQSYLDYEDKNSMAYGIECRVPLLYDDIQDFSLNTSLDSHFENGPKSILRNHNKLPYYLRNEPKFAFAANLSGYLIKDQKKIKEKIYYDFKNIPMIENEKLLKLQNDQSKNDIFFRTYSYGLWYNSLFKEA
tara:strand:+ start:3889 stop:5673 length:1785 start_codon:yes stop_codon:yes gene_type:complete